MSVISSILFAHQETEGRVSHGVRFFRISMMAIKLNIEAAYNYHVRGMLCTGLCPVLRQLVPHNAHCWDCKHHALHAHTFTRTTDAQNRIQLSALLKHLLARKDTQKWTGEVLCTRLQKTGLKRGRIGREEEREGKWPSL